MPKLWSSLLGRNRAEKAEQRLSVNMFGFNGVQYPIIGGSSVHEDVERPADTFVSYVNGSYKQDGVVFACMLARMMIFSEARFQFQQMRRGRPGDLFGTRELAVLERPWPNGTTGDLLSRMIQDADLAGNFYAVREGRRLRRLRPDWVDIVLTAPPAEAVQSDVVGYVYHPGGRGASNDGVPFPVDRVVHWAPVPDPDSQYRGMSWLTPIINEIQADKAATLHKKKFFENGATLQTVLTLGENITQEQFKTWVRAFREAHRGVQNAYEPLFLGGGADAKIIGADMSQLDFKATQGAGETRIAADSGIHPVIVGLSEGLAGSSLNEGNFNAARRVTADKTIRPLWRSASGALETVVRVPEDARLWFDEKGVAFLRDDRKDVAEIQRTQAVAIRQLLEVGYEADASVQAVIDDEYSQLLGQHTGLPSVQLQPRTNVSVPDESDEVDDGDDNA